MEFRDYKIIQKLQYSSDTSILRLKPVNGNNLMEFLPGQYVKMKNPNYIYPDEIHHFSIASPPHQKKYLEFCIKAYGNWTKTVMNIKEGNVLKINGPYGEFIPKKNYKDCVFLVGGAAISPVISILRYMETNGHGTYCVLIYGNTNLSSIIYKEELEKIFVKRKWKLVHVLSQPNGDVWNGYRGFINEKIIEKELNLSPDKKFFVIGSPFFTKSMVRMLRNISISDNRIILEKH